MLSFSSDQFVADASRDPLPAGVYPVRITQASFNPLKSGNGHAVNLTYEVIDGPHARRKVWGTLNVIHKNPDAQRIAQSDLKKLCDACGGVVITESTTHLLINKVLRIKVKIRVDAQYGDKNEVVGYEAAPGLAATPSFLATSAAALQKPAPWANA